MGPQYCLKLMFVSMNDSIELTLFKEAAASFVGIPCEEFAKMKLEEQESCLQKLKLKQVSACVFSNKTMVGDVKHTVESVGEPEFKLQLGLIERILNLFPNVKMEAEW